MDKLSTVLYFLLPLSLVLSEPQEEVQSSDQSEKALAQDEKIVKAVRTQNPVYIDGELKKFPKFERDEIAKYFE